MCTHGHTHTHTHIYRILFDGLRQESQGSRNIYVWLIWSILSNKDSMNLLKEQCNPRSIVFHFLSCLKKFRFRIGLNRETKLLMDGMNEYHKNATVTTWDNEIGDMRWKLKHKRVQTPWILALDNLYYQMWLFRGKNIWPKLTRSCSH